ncbi:PAS domain-containing protein [Haematococcus lacustris]|uniref:PAS domain-containing protein n=1 Tax=Haematococcus lacustris TaxID=44745 RepID=A0A699YZW1_HAELA|nr:PAS domain-containing protein [Haematococcus lacustris]
MARNNSARNDIAWNDTMFAYGNGTESAATRRVTGSHWLPCPLPTAQGLATALRTSIKALVKGGAANALENLLPQPLALLHRSLAMSIPLHSPPAYSCRSGLAVPLLISGVRDNDSAPFRLRMYQQDKDALGADEVFHVTTLRQASMTEALAERCLSLVVDPSTGRVLSTGSSPLALFGYHPQQLLGSCLADLLDVLQPPQPGAQDKTSRDKTGPGSYASAVMAHMAAEAFSRGEVGFRAGLLKPASQVDSLLSSVAHFLTPEDATACQAALPQLYPALMVVRPHLPDAADQAGIHQLLHPPLTQPDYSHVMAAKLYKDKSCTSTAFPQDGGRSVAWAGWQPDSQQHASDAAVHVSLTQALGQMGQHRREAVKQVEGSCLYRHVSFSPTPTSAWLQQSTKAAGNPSAQGPAASSLGLPSPSPVLLEVHLWRAELACSVVELNEAGQVVGPDAALPLYPPGLLFGVHATQLVGRHISHFLPDLASMGDLSCLLEPVPPPGTVQLMHSPQGLVPAASAAAQTGRKGVLKSVVSLTAAELQQGKKPRVGPLLLLAANQHSEGTSMEVSVQAVRKSSGNGMWLVMHPYQPKAGRPDLGTWLAGRRLGAQAQVAAGVTQAQLNDPAMPMDSVTCVGRPSMPVPTTLQSRVTDPRPGPTSMTSPQLILHEPRPSVCGADGPDAVRGVGFSSHPLAQFAPTQLAPTQLARLAFANSSLRGVSCPVIQEASLGIAGTSPRPPSWQQQPAGSMPRLATSHAQEPLPTVPTSQQAPGHPKDQRFIASDAGHLDSFTRQSSANTAPVAQWVLSDGAQFMTDRPPLSVPPVPVQGMASSSQHTYLRAPSRVSLPKLSSFTKSGRVHPEVTRQLVPDGQGSSGQLLVEEAPYGGPGSAQHSHGQGVEADIVDGSDDAEGNRLDAGKSGDDQAELGVADYNRGKRYKKLARMLYSTSQVSTLALNLEPSLALGPLELAKSALRKVQTHDRARLNCSLAGHICMWSGMHATVFDWLVAKSQWSTRGTVPASWGPIAQAWHRCCCLLHLLATCSASMVFVSCPAAPSSKGLTAAGCGWCVACASRPESLPPTICTLFAQRSCPLCAGAGLSSSRVCITRVKLRNRWSLKPLVPCRVGALVLVATILAVHIAVFALLYSVIAQQRVGVLDLNNAGA